MSDGFDPAKDAVNREKHKLSLSFGDRIFEDDSHLIVPSIREEDGEERFKVIGLVEGKLFTDVFFCLARRSSPFHVGEKEQHR